MLEAVLARTRAALLTDVPFCLLPELQFAWAAAQRISQRGHALDRGGSITVLTGPQGCGKSLLAHQALRQVLRRPQKQSIFALKPADWSPLVGEALDAACWLPWQEAFAGVGYLLCEDLDEVVASGVSGERVAGWLDQLLLDGTRVIVTLSQWPGECTQFPGRLTSRLRGGLIASIPTLSATSRRQFLDWSAQARQVSITEEISDWLVNRPPGSLRSLSDAMERLFAEFPPPARISNWEAVRRILNHPQQARLPLDVIAEHVAIEFGVSATQLRHTTRLQAYRQARQCAMVLAHDLGGWPMAEIGRYFGNRTHTSVSYSCRKFQNSIEQDVSLRGQLQRLQSRLSAAVEGRGVLTGCG